VRWARSLTSKQRAILATLALSVIAVVSLLGWSIWRSLNAEAVDSPFAPPPTHATSVLPIPPPVTQTPSLPTATKVPAPTETPTTMPGFDVSQAGLVAADVSEARQSRTRWGTPLSLVDQTGMARALYRHYQNRPPVALQAQSSLQALNLWFWDALRLDIVSQASDTAVFYVPETQELLLRRDWDGALDTLETQLAYGYARALPDQYGDLTRLMDEATTLDRKLALTAVAEGDAFIALLLHRGLMPGSDASAALQAEVARAICPRWQIEDVLLEDLTCLAFRLGTEFAVAQYLDGGTDALDEAILRPPWSTEQLIDRDRYLAFEPPHLLTPLTPELAPGWTLTTTETLGQAIIGVTLAEWHDSGGEVDAQITDWGGDLLQIWEGPDDHSLAAWQISWDNVSAAVNIYGDLTEILPRQLVSGLIRDTTATAGLPRGRWWAGERGAAFLYRKVDTIWLIWGTDPATVERTAITLNPTP
jgi:hypothetical protein